jgi:DNA polymerase-3 subunit epsilon
MARRKHPGQRNSLDALCQRYGVDNSQRDLHGALLDAEILADVYLTMTGGQTALLLSESAAEGDENGAGGEQIRRLPDSRLRLPVIRASAEEIAAHEVQLDIIAAQSEGRVLWRELMD